jgi:hypothetical protein
MKIPHAELDREYEMIMDEIRNGRHNAALHDYLDIDAVMTVALALDQSDENGLPEAILIEGIEEYAKELATERVYSRDDYPSPK